MKKENWSEDQPVLKDDLERAQDTKEDAIRERLTDLFLKGVLLKSQLAGETNPFTIAQGPSAGLFVTVNTGVAYSPLGERIIVSAISSYIVAAPTTTTDNGIGGTTLTPISTGSQNIPVTDASTNRIWLGYLKTIDSSIFTLKRSNNERLFVKSDDGFEIVTTTTSTNPDSTRFILIGEVVTAAGAVTSISLDNVAEAQPVHNDTVGPSPAPLEVTLPSVPIAIPAVVRDPGGTPVVLTFTAGAPGTGQFTVNFDTGVLTFAVDSDGETVDVTFTSLKVRREIIGTDDVRVQIPVVDKPTSYSTGLPVTFQDHVAARGGGTILSTNPHGLAAADIGLADVANLGAQLSSSGIILPTGNASSPVSALSPRAVSSPILGDNKVSISSLTTTEAVNINGVIVTSTDIPSITEFDFKDPANPTVGITAGTYTFFIDPTDKTLKRILGAAPTDAFLIASIAWSSTELQAPITDLRVFGTTAAPNIRFEVLGALSIGLASGNRASTFFHARLTGSIAGTGSDPAFLVGGDDIDITVDSTPGTITFPGAASSSLALFGTGGIIDTITGSIASIKAVATSTNEVKMLASISLLITGGTALAALGFSVSDADDNDLKEIFIAGDTATIGVDNTSKDVEVSLFYDATPQTKLIQTVSSVGNKILTTDITYNTDDTIATVTETVV